MMLRFAAALVLSFGLAGLAVAAAQMSADDERRAAVTVLRAINTAEHAVMRQTGKYAPMETLIDHPMMARVKPNITASSGTFRHAEAEVRISLSPDATQYVVTVVSGAPTHNAAFSDERGLIYTGRALQ